MNYDIYRAVNILSERQPVYINADNYYRGAHREIFATQRWSRLFNRSGSYTLNFAKTVVDTVLDRLEIATVKGETKASDKALNEIWEENELVLDSTEIHRRALTYGECYAIVWPDEDGDVTITYNSPLTTIIIYDQENPRIKRYASKMWEVRNALNVATSFMNLYYPDRIEKYTRAGEISVVGNAGGTDWTLIERVDNPFGEIPVFHFRTHRPYGTPEHAAAIGPQDAINKMVNNHMVTVDYQGAPQRYALSSYGTGSELTDFEDDDTARENITGLQSGPGELWYLNGVTQVGQFAPADPKVFTEPILAYVKSMASLTQTPLHYFQNNGQFASGEALRTAEAPLIKKVKERQLSFGATWRELFRFALKIEGIDVDVQVKWQSAESIDSTDSWSIAQIKLAMGIPLETVLMEMGYDSVLAKEIADAAKANQAANPMAAQDLSVGMNAHNAALHAAAQQHPQTAVAAETAVAAPGATPAPKQGMNN